MVGDMENVINVLVDAIRHIRGTHMNTYSWSLPISDEEALDLLMTKIVEIEGSFRA